MTWVRMGLVLGAVCFGLLPAGQAQDKRDGLFITVPNPITSQAVQQIKLKVEDAVERKRRNIQTVVFDFNPQDQPSVTTAFGVCNDLADVIRSLQRGFKNKYPPMSTIAFVHHEVAGHSVLPVLACRQIVMSSTVEASKRPKARLGDILRGQDRELRGPERLEYQQIGQALGWSDLIERMMNKDFLLKKARTTEGVRYVGLATLEKWDKEGKQFQLEGDVPGLEPGSSMFDGDLAQRIGLVQERYNSKGEIASALRLPRNSLAEDWLLGKTPVAARIEVRGSLDKGSLDSLERRVRAAIGRNANLLILELHSEAGDTAYVANTAKWLRTLSQDTPGNPVKSIAYIPPGRSIGAATFLALACSEIVMGKDAALGDFSYLWKPREKEDIQEAAQRLKEEMQRRKDLLLPLAREQGYPEALFEATLDERVVLYRVKSRTDPNDERLIAEEQLEADKKLAKPRWENRGRIDHPAGQMLRITTPLAREWGVAASADVDTVESLYAYYGLDASKVKVARDDWLGQIAEFFREPTVYFVLIMLGIVGLILEMKMPGATVPGILSAVCFVLFFWSYSFVGEFTVLAVLLFLLGLVLVGVEVFLLPGFGFTGVTGLVLILSSLALVTLERMPETSQDWMNLGMTFSTFGLSLVAAIFAVVVIAWYLPHVPYANRLVLQPPEEMTGSEASFVLGAPPAALLGQIGVAATPLRPAGKVQFDDDFYDVVAEGDYVNPGARVQVIEIEGNRIAVKEV